MTKSLKDIFKITTLFSGVQGLNILLNLVRTKLAAVILGPSGIGLNSIYNEMRELIHTTTNLGMDVSAVREISQAFETHDAKKIEDSVTLTRSWALLLAMFGALVCLVLAEPISWITFTDLNHTWDFALLSPSVAFSTLTCGEMAILKGVHKIKALAIISVTNVIVGILTTIPVYYIWGLAGVVPALVLLTFVLFLVVICYSYREFPLSFNLNSSILRKGFPMLTIGMSFVLTGIIGHGTELAIRTYLNNAASLETVGLYSAGYTIVMTYGGVLFASLDNDYFPRLSGIYSDTRKRIDTMNKQIEVLLMLIIPLIILLIVILPIAVPILFSSKFNAVIPMAQIASMGLLFRAVFLPVGYLPLSAGDSKSFLFLEIISYAIILTAIITCYDSYGLLGTGIALSASNFVDMIVALVFVKWRYGVSINRRIFLSLLGATTGIVTMLFFYFLVI